MASTEESSRRHLMGLRHPNSKRPLLDPALLRPHWYALPSAATAAFIDEFCAKMPLLGYVGWRNPWDQDEIMVSHSAARVASGAARGRESACG